MRTREIIQLLRSIKLQDESEIFKVNMIVNDLEFESKIDNILWILIGATLVGIIGWMIGLRM